METIIRSASVSQETRQLKRPSAVREQSNLSALQISAEAAPARVIETAETALPSLNTPSVQEQQQEMLERNMRSQIEQELANARMQIEKELETARAAAEREGFANGMAKAEDAARKAVAEQVARLESIIAALSQTRTAIIDDAEDAIVELAYTAICRIVGDAVMTRSAVAGVVEQVLMGFKEHESLIVRLNPQDVELLQQGANSTDGWTATLRADTSIRIGGCIVDSGNGTVDARLETQLTRLCEALLSARRQRQNGEAL